MKKFLLYSIGAILLISAILLIYLIKISQATTAPIKDAYGNTVASSIASLEKINLGGIDQWLLIRGRNKDNPLLLFLHGGPGSPELPMVRHYNQALEDHFVVVNWDQRGAGKSYSRHLPDDIFIIDGFVDDVHELTQYLKERFNKNKIFIVGHSWGTIIGMKAIQQNPDNYLAYVGIGQVVNMEEGEKISYDYTLAKAIELNDEKAIKKLKEIGSPPYMDDDNFERLMVQRNLLIKFGGALYGKTDYNEIVKTLIGCEEYSLRDKLNYLLGAKRTVELLWKPLMEVNIRKEVPEVKVPVYFVAGRHDYQVPSSLADAYHKVMIAPKKEIIWFEKSGHAAPFEESEKFNDLMINKILKENLPEGDSDLLNVAY